MNQNTVAPVLVAASTMPTKYIQKLAVAQHLLFGRTRNLPKSMPILGVNVTNFGRSNSREH